MSPRLRDEALNQQRGAFVRCARKTARCAMRWLHLGHQTALHHRARHGHPGHDATTPALRQLSVDRVA